MSRETRREFLAQAAAIALAFGFGFAATSRTSGSCYGTGIYGVATYGKPRRRHAAIGDIQ